MSARTRMHALHTAVCQHGRACTSAHAGSCSTCTGHACTPEVEGQRLRAYLAQTERVLGVLVHPCTRFDIHVHACLLEVGTDSLRHRHTQGAVVLRLAGWHELVGQRRSERVVVAGIQQADLRTARQTLARHARMPRRAQQFARAGGRAAGRARARTRAMRDVAPCFWDILRRLRTNLSRYLVP